MTFIEILKDFRLIAVYFTAVYMWIASCHYLIFNVNVTSGNACFYGGLAVIFLSLLMGFVNQYKRK